MSEPTAAQIVEKLREEREAAVLAESRGKSRVPLSEYISTLDALLSAWELVEAMLSDCRVGYNKIEAGERAKSKARDDVMKLLGGG